MSNWLGKCQTLADSARQAAEDALDAEWWACVFTMDMTIPGDADFAVAGVIHERVLAFAGPTEIEHASTMAKELTRAAGEVKNEKDSALGNIKVPLMEEWEGTAADNFELYVGNVMAAVERQSTLIESFAAATTVYEHLVRAMHEDLADLVTSGIAALDDESADGGSVGGGVAGAVEEALTLLARNPADAVLTALRAAPGKPALGHAANGVVEVVRKFALDLRLLREVFDAQLAAVTQGFKEVGALVKLDLPVLNPDVPRIVSGKRFDPDDFGLPGVPRFDKVKSKVPTGDLVKHPDSDREASGPR